MRTGAAAWRASTVHSVTTRALSCAYLEHGPADGDAIFLIHGFPDDARTWEAIAPGLAADGLRTIAPYVRGFGATRLLPEAERTGETAAITRDVLDLADALGIERFHVVGHDWGARAAYSLAALAPQRIRTITALANGYATNVASAAMDAEQLRAYWYQWYFATPRGERALRESRAAFCRDLWRMWSPSWTFDETAYAQTAASFENPDFVDLVLHSYRCRWGFAPFAAAYAADRSAIEAHPPIAIPTAVLMGERDGATLPASTAGRETYFRAAYEVRVLAGCGHFIPRERPADVLATVRALISGALAGGDAAASR
jgi:pimeloyl-ACP methyl ester carboxylesterase